MLVRVADNGGDAGERGDFLRSALGVASGDNNFRQRILTPDTPYGGAGILIRGIGNRAGVQNYEISLRGGSGVQAAGFKLACQSRAVSLRGAASKVFYVVGGHGTMVAQAGHKWGSIRSAAACQANEPEQTERTR
jgi:hypothetical protein